MSTSAMPGIVKIGYTLRDPAHRLKEANGAFKNVAAPWRIHFAKEVDDVKLKEAFLHRVFSSQRVEGAVEQFEVSVHTVAEYVYLMDGKWWIPSFTGKVEKCTPFEGHLYASDEAIIHGLRLKYDMKDRRFFPHCRRIDCNCDEFSIPKWKNHLWEVHEERLRNHNSKVPPKPRRRAGFAI